jgi:hypothetical protein
MYQHVQFLLASDGKYKRIIYAGCKFTTYYPSRMMGKREIVLKKVSIKMFNKASCQN